MSEDNNTSNNINTSSSSWELSQTLLTVDGLGVRCAAVLPPPLLPTTTTTTTTTTSSSSSTGEVVDDVWYRIVTGNQGGSIVEYSIPSGTIQVLDRNQHNHAVTAILSSSLSSVNIGSTGSSSNSNTTTDIYITACKDGMIRIFHATTHDLIVHWQAHDKPATSLSFGGDGKERYLISGSWDGTAKVWDISDVLNSDNATGTSIASAAETKVMPTPNLISTLPNHENSVCVASLHNSSASSNDVLYIVTGSAGMAQGNMIRDHSVRLWHANVMTGETTLQYTMANDHEGPIRDVLTTQATTGTSHSSLLATCSNDGTVHVRDPFTGTTLSTLVFSYEEHPPMLLSMTYAESNTNNSDDNANDAITGSMVAAAEAGHVVFWNHAAVNVGQPQIVRHTDCVWNVVSLPNGDVATCCQDGTVRIFTRVINRMAEESERQQFIDSVNMALQALQNGPTSEEVMKLHPWHLSYEKQGISEGQVHLFNKNNVAIAAQWSMDSQTWIEVGEVTGQGGASGNTIDGISYDHILPIELEQTNGQVSTLQIGYNNGENPYTAGQRFIDKHMLPQSYLSQISDYITQRVGKQPTVLGMSSSTTASASTPQTGAAFTGTPIAYYEHIPGKVYKSFDLVDKTAATTFEKMKNKIQEFGCHENDIPNIVSLMATLQGRNRYHASKVTDLELSTLSNLFTTFTVAQTFPALDLVRLTVLHPDASTKERFKYWSSIIQSAVILCQTDTSVLVDENGGGPAVTAVPMLTLRLFSNALKSGYGSRMAIVEQLNDVMNCATFHGTSTNKNIRLSVTTLLYNVCLYIQQQNTSSTAADSTINWDVYVPSIVGLIVEIINSKVPYESEALIRAMIAMGTIAMVSPTAKGAFSENYLASKVEPLASSHGDVAKAVAKEVYSVLS